MSYIKATGPTLYIRPISINELDVIRECVADWRADGVTLSEKETKVEVLNWVKQMKWALEETTYLKRKDESGHYILDIQNSEEWRSQGIKSVDGNGLTDPNTRISWVEGIFLRSDDTCVGINKAYWKDQDFQLEMTAMHPDYRGQGIWDEATKIGLKSLFIALPNVRSLTTWVPVEKRNTAGDQLATIAEETTDSTVTLADRIDEVTYDKRVITREQFLAWYNLPEQENLRNLYHKLEVIEEDLF